MGDDPRLGALLALTEHVLAAIEIVPEVPDPEAHVPAVPPQDPEDGLLYKSDAADELPCVALGGRRIIKK